MSMNWRIAAAGFGFLLAVSACADDADNSASEACDSGAAADQTAADASGEASASEKLAGLWHVVAWDLKMPDGTMVKPFGDKPTGTLFFQKDQARFWGILNHTTNAPKFKDETSPFKGTADESKAAHDTYIGYAGTYTVQEADSTVTLKVENAWTPNWVGTDQVRKFTFTKDGGLTLAPTNFEGNQLIFKR